MTPALAELMQSSRELLWAGFLVFLRVGGVMAVLPAFGEMMIPARVKLVLALAFTAVVLPAVQSFVTAPNTSLPVPIWCLAEVMIGLAIGLSMRFFVICLQISGTIIAQSTSLSQLFGGTAGEPQPAVGELMVLAGLAIAVHFGLHVKVSEILVGSYQVFPPGDFPDADLIRQWSLSGIAQSFSLAFSIAAPFVIGGLLYNVALGAINRAMPQLMVSMIGAPAQTLGGLMLMAIAVPIGLLVWREHFDLFLANPFEVAR